MSILLPSEELIRKIEHSEKDYMKDRMEAIQSRNGNPEGVELGYYGKAICFYSATMPWPSFNTVKGMTSEDIKYVKEIIQFYRYKKRKFQFEIVPSSVDPQLLAELSNVGFYQSGFHVSLYCSPTNVISDTPEHIQIKEAGVEDFLIYATIHCRGTGLPDHGIPYVAENNKILWKRQGWKFFIAYVENQPAAVGVMFTKQNISSLTFSATLPEFRGIGLHQNLLKRRISESFQQGCQLVVSQCAFLSQSQRNMERAGMRVGYVRTTWTEH